MVQAMSSTLVAMQLRVLQGTRPSDRHERLPNDR